MKAAEREAHTRHHLFPGREAGGGGQGKAYAAEMVPESRGGVPSILSFLLLSFTTQPSLPLLITTQYHCQCHCFFFFFLTVSSLIFLLSILIGPHFIYPVSAAWIITPAFYLDYPCHGYNNVGWQYSMLWSMAGMFLGMYGQVTWAVSEGGRHGRQAGLRCGVPRYEISRETCPVSLFHCLHLSQATGTLSQARKELSQSLPLSGHCTHNTMQAGTASSQSVQVLHKSIYI